MAEAHPEGTGQTNEEHLGHHEENSDKVGPFSCVLIHVSLSAGYERHFQLDSLLSSLLTVIFVIFFYRDVVGLEVY